MNRFFAFLTLVCSAIAQSPLPQSVYDQIADTNIAVINMPHGIYTLPGSAPLVLRRSGVVVNFSGCTLLVNPADKANDGFYPIQVASITITSPKYPGGPGSRYLAHLVGSISERTTQLTMDPAEAVSLTPGERVLIWAGATPSDPVEPAAFIPATVASVDSKGVITFSAPIGKNIVNYGSLAGMSNATSSSLQWKIGAWGTWPSGANFSKGFGTDHGLERFVGGMVHDVTFNDLTMRLQTVDAAHSPNAMWDISTVAVQKFTLRNASIVNPHGNSVHFWRSFDALVDGATFSGHGQSKIWNKSMSEAFALTAWGGVRLTYRNVTVTGTDIMAFNTEVGSDNIVVDGLNFDVEFTSARNYASSPTVLGFHAPANRPRITDASIHAVTSGGSAHGHYSYDPLDFYGNLGFPGSSLTAWLDFGYQKFPTLNGTVTIDRIVYGPGITLTTNVTLLHGAGSRTFTPCEGIYTTARFRITTLGSLRSVTDSFGNSYWTIAQTGAWVPLASNNWQNIGPGITALSNYLGKDVRFWFNSPSVADAVAEFEFTYLPRQ